MTFPRTFAGVQRVARHVARVLDLWLGEHARGLSDEPGVPGGRDQRELAARLLCAAELGKVSMCPLPTYLLQAGDARYPNLLELIKLGKQLVYGQILTLARTIRALDASPPAGLQTRVPPVTVMARS